MKTYNVTSFTRVLPIAFGVFIAFSGARSFADNSPLDSTDKSFIKGAYEDGVDEIKMGELAGRKTANPDVKSFAQKLTTDHTQANGELKTIADSKKVEVSGDPSMVATGKMKMLDTKSGNEFDKAFVDGMVTAHQKAVETFTKEVAEGKDAETKAFAEKALPTLKEHLTNAEAIQQKIGQ